MYYSIRIKKRDIKKFKFKSNNHPLVSTILELPFGMWDVDVSTNCGKRVNEFEGYLFCLRSVSVMNFKT